MKTVLSKDILQSLWLYEADCYFVYMNRTLHFTCLQLLKSRGQGQLLHISSKFEFFSFVSMVTAKNTRTLLSPIGYLQIACDIKVLVDK